MQPAGTRRHQPLRTRATKTAAAVALTLLLASCTQKAPASTDADIGLENLTPKPAGQEAIDAVLEFVGGTPGPATGEPLRFGWLNADTGPAAAPEATPAVLAAAAFVNQELGGIGGRPIEILTCDTGSAEQTETCARDYGDDTTLTAVLTGRTPWATDVIADELAGTPIAGIEPGSGSEYQNPDATYLVLGKAGVLIAAATLAQQRQDPGPIAIVVEEGAALQAETFAAAPLRDAGIDTTIVEVGRDQQKTLDELVASDAHETIIVNLGPDGCIALGYALGDRDDIAVITSGQCAHRSVYDEFGDWTKGWVHIGGGPDLANYDKDPHTAVYRDRLLRYAGDDAEWTGLATLSFALVMNIARIANTGEPDRGNLTGMLRSYTGPGFMSMPTHQCGYTEAAPALCQHLARAYRYAGKRVWEDVLDTDFIDMSGR